MQKNCLSTERRKGTSSWIELTAKRPTTVSPGFYFLERDVRDVRGDGTRDGRNNLNLPERERERERERDLSQFASWLSFSEGICATCNVVVSKTSLVVSSRDKAIPSNEKMNNFQRQFNEF